MTSIYIACVHGINHTDQEQETFHRSWRNHLMSQGIKARTHNCGWNSTASSVIDSVAMLVNPVFKEEAVRKVAGGLDNFNTFAPTFAPRLVIAHSMGTALAYEAMKRRGYEWPLLCLGSPATNPIAGPALEMAGFWDKWPQSDLPRAIVNPDDPVCATRRMTRHPTCMDFRFIETDVEGQSIFREHDAEIYLKHTASTSFIRDIIAKHAKAYAEKKAEA